jgi:hypothetical protein
MTLRMALYAMASIMKEENPHGRTHMRRRQVSEQLPGFEPVHPIEKALLVIIVASIPVATTAVLNLDAEQVIKLSSETGPFEIIAALLWFVLATVCIHNLDYAGRYPTGLAFLAVIFGARELDFHRQLTGGSIFKLDYYRMAEAPLIEKLAAGLAALAILSLIGWLVATGVRAFLQQKAWRWVWGRLVILASSLLVCATILDRSPRALKDHFDIAVSWTGRYLFLIHEEWFESMVPMIFIVAIFFWSRLNAPQPYRFARRHQTGAKQR